MDAKALLCEYVASHNAGVTSGDFGPMLALFEPDAILRFVGLPFAPRAGLAAIAAAFAAHPPCDTLVLLPAEADAGAARAPYARQAAPGEPAGSLLLEAAGGRISALSISAAAGRADPLQTAYDVVQARYPDCTAAFLAGSVVRGQATAHSDLDLVVLCDQVAVAYRESFTVGGWPVEAFVHDPETLAYFFCDLDAKAGRPALPQMVAEGIALPLPSPLTRALQQEAAALLAAGPPPLSEEEARQTRRGNHLPDADHAPRERSAKSASSGKSCAPVAMASAADRGWRTSSTRSARM